MGNIDTISKCINWVFKSDTIVHNLNMDDVGCAYVSRRKRRREEPLPSHVESQDIKTIATTTMYEASPMQEASWARQEQGIVVEGEGLIPSPIRRFSELAVSPDAVSVLTSRRVIHPSAVQAQTLPCIFQGRDVVALAPTGSGKTLCYILAIVELLQRLHDQSQFKQYVVAPLVPTEPCALVIVPTRELVDQIVQDLSAFFPDQAPPPVIGIFGGIAIDMQLSRLRQHTYDASVVVATPGRLLDLVLRHRTTLSLGQLSLLVVDEVDRVLQIPEMEAQLREILQLSNPAGRQTLLLSATLPIFLPRIARSAVLQPITIRVDEASIPRQHSSALRSLTSNTSAAAMLALSRTSNVIHDVQFMRPAEKPSRLLRVLRAIKQPPVLVFCNSRSNVERIARLLRNEQFHVAPLHGGQPQGYRIQVLRAFRAGYVDILVATDLASRGLDFPGVENVVLFDIPNTIEDYLHRCGRTGRHPGGDAGVSHGTAKATSFLTRECTIAMELKQVLQAARQSLPRELDIPRNFVVVNTPTSLLHKQ